MTEIKTIKPLRTEHLFRVSTSKGGQVVVGSLSEKLTPQVIAEIEIQKTSGNYREIAGRPWWASRYSAEELKEAGLIS